MLDLWQQFGLTAQGLLAVHQGRSADEYLQQLPPDQRAGVQALLYAGLRQWGLTQTLTGLLCAKAPKPSIAAVLHTALATLTSPEVAYQPHTVVMQAVRCMTDFFQQTAAAGFVNACLRRFLREREDLLASALSSDTARYNLPAWWLARLKADWPETWERIARTSQLKAPMTLRVAGAATSEAVKNQYAASAEGSWVGAQAFALQNPRPVGQVPGFLQGRVSVQDAAAQLAAPLLLEALLSLEHERAKLKNPEAASSEPLKVLDACAAPGGKTTHLLEYAAERGLPIAVTALDIDPKRCERIASNLERLKLKAQVLCADLAQPQSWLPPGETFDAILLDAPCSASGIVRRHPDIAWLRQAEDIARLGGTQLALLRQAWDLLKPGGFVLFATCSVFKTEGEAVVRKFTKGFLEPATPFKLHVKPHEGAQILGQIVSQITGQTVGQIATQTEAQFKPLRWPSAGHLLPTIAAKALNPVPLTEPNANDAPTAYTQKLHTLLHALSNHDGFFYALLHKPCRTTA